MFVRSPVLLYLLCVLVSPTNYTISLPHTSFHCSCIYCSVPVSAHGCLNITRDFGPHGHLSRIKIPYVCIEAATVVPWSVVHGKWALARDTTVMLLTIMIMDLLIRNCMYVIPQPQSSESEGERKSSRSTGKRKHEESSYSSTPSKKQKVDNTSHWR